MKKIVTGFFILVLAFSSKAAVFTSVASGPYSSPSTWTFTGVDADGIPDNDDLVTIAAPNTVTLTSSSNAKTLTINPSATINLNAFVMLVWGDLTNNGTSAGVGVWQFRASGTYTGNAINNNGSIYFYSSYTIGAGAPLFKGGSILISSNCIVTNNRSINLSPGTIQFGPTGSKWINASGSFLSVTLDIVGTGTFNCSAINNTVLYQFNSYTTVYTTNATYYNLNLSSTSSATIALAGDLVVLNNFSIFSSVKLDWASNNITLGGNWTNNANISGVNMGQITFNGSGIQTITRTGAERFNSVNCAETGSVKLMANVIANGTTTLASGILDPNTFIYHQRGISWLDNGGTINTAATGEISFDGGVNQTVGGTISTTFGNVEINNPGFSVTLTKNQIGSGTTTLTNGIFDPATFTWNQTGASWMANGGTINSAAAGEVDFDGAIPQSIDGTVGATFGNIEFASTSTVSLARDLTTVGTTTLTSGTLNPSTFTYHQKGNSWLGNGGSCSLAATGKIVFDGGINEIIGGSTGTIFGNVEINNPGFSVQLAIDETGSGTTTLTSGILDPGTFIWNQKGASWMANGGTINTAAAGEIDFDGAIPQSIDGTVGATFGNIEIASSSTVSLARDLNAAGTLSITSGTLDISAGLFNVNLAGNFVHNGGAFTQRTGTVFFNGSSAQTLSGSITTTFYNITSNNTVGGVSVSSIIIINNILQVNSRSFGNTPLGNIILTATGATTYARIGTLGVGASLTGSNWSIGSYVDGPAPAYWQYLGSPITSSTLADWDNDNRFYMSGVGGNDGNACCPVFHSVRTYNEASNTYSNITSTATVLTPGRGFMVWMADNLSSLTAPLPFDTKGAPNQGTIVRAVTAGGAGNGYNLVSNPYACPITYASVVASSGCLMPNFLILTENGSYVTNPNGGVIAPAQGFMCIATSNGNMKVSESAKTTLINPNIIRTAAPENYLTINSGNATNGLGGAAVVQILPDAHNGVDLDYDMPFLPSPYEDATNIWTTDRDGKNLLLNALDGTNDMLDIPLSVVAGTPGDQLLSFKGINSFSGYSCVWLEDITSGEKINLKDHDTYSFPANAVGEQHNFNLHFERTASCPLNDQNITASLDAMSQVFVNNGNLLVQFGFDEKTDVTVDVLNALGQEVSTPKNVNVSKETIALANPEAHGVYLVRITRGTETVTKKIYY